MYTPKLLHSMSELIIAELSNIPKGTTLVQSNRCSKSGLTFVAKFGFVKITVKINATGWDL